MQVPGPSTFFTGDPNQVGGQMDINRVVTENSNPKGERIKVFGNQNPQMRKKEE